MSRIEEIAGGAAEQIQLALDELEREYFKLRRPLAAALMALKEHEQRELPLPKSGPVTQLADEEDSSSHEAVDDGGDDESGDDEPQISLRPSNVEMVSDVINRLPSEFSIHMIYQLFERTHVGLLKPRQIATAFRKLCVRKNPGFSIYREGSGNSPHLYRKDSIQ